MDTKSLMKKYIYPVAVMSGSIGVGFLSLPYVAMKAGILVTFFYFIFLVSAILVINLSFAEISLKTPDFKRFPGFAGYHLGKWAKAIALVSEVIGYFGVLLAYLIVGGEFLTAVFSPMLGGNNLIYTLIYFILAVFLVYIGIKTIAKVELINICILGLAILFIFIKGFSFIKFGNITGQAGSSLDFFLPYGPILFSLWGVGLIPETEEMLRDNKKLMKKVIVAGTLIPATIYFFFVLLVLSITGSQTTESALIGLKNFLGNGVMTFSLFAVALATFVAFVIYGLTLKKILNYDFKIKEIHALIIACFTPMILFMLGLKSFIFLISFVGGVLLGVNGILILLMYKKIGGKKWIIYPLSAIFLFGVIYQIIYFLKLL